MAAKIARQRPARLVQRTESKNVWMIDKHVPVALLMAILGQSAAGIWWAAGVNFRVADTEKRIERMANLIVPSLDRITRLEGKMDGIAIDVGEIKILLRPRQARADR